jgi:hypothetical protein
MRNFAERILSDQPAGATAIIERSREGARREWSFRAVRASAEDVAAKLVGLGVRRGDVVMTVVGNRPEWVFAMLAAFRQGFVVLPCNEQLRAKDLRQRLDAVDVAAVIADPRNRAELEAAGVSCPVIWTDELEPSPSAPPPVAAVGPDKPALMTFTSGTSGQPKCVVHAHRCSPARPATPSAWADGVLRRAAPRAALRRHPVTDAHRGRGRGAPRDPRPPAPAALDRTLAARVARSDRALAHPSLVCDVAIGQSTVVTQRVIANLFYRGLRLLRAVALGDTLTTEVEVVALRDSSSRPAGLVALRVETHDQEERRVLDFVRCAMLPLSPARHRPHTPTTSTRSAATATPGYRTGISPNTLSVAGRSKPAKFSSHRSETP